MWFAPLVIRGRGVVWHKSGQTNKWLDVECKEQGVPPCKVADPTSSNSLAFPSLVDFAP